MGKMFRPGGGGWDEGEVGGRENLSLDRKICQKQNRTVSLHNTV